MRVRWPDSFVTLFRFLTAKAPNPRGDIKAAPDFLFERWQLDSNCIDRTPGQPLQPGVHLISSGQAPYRRTRSESLTLPRTVVPALNIAANAS
jgi:hypothetical protein